MPVVTMNEQLTAKKFASLTAKLDGISERTMTEHYKLYEGYVKKYNEVMDKLRHADRASANQTYSELRSLKVALTFAIGGVKNHEIYFAHLGGTAREPRSRMKNAMERYFGSFEKWKEDLKATGMASRGWAWTAWDHDYEYLFNYAGDAQNTFPVWNATPIVALDVYEHAYYIDYGTARANYIDAFFRNLDWDVVEENFARLRVG